MKTVKLLSNHELVVVLRRAMELGTKPHVVEALKLEAFDRVLRSL